MFCLMRPLWGEMFGHKIFYDKNLPEKEENRYLLCEMKNMTQFDEKSK